MKNVPFHIPHLTGKETTYIKDAISRGKYSGGGHYHSLCESYLESLTTSPKVLLTSSCTHALEMCALLCDIREGDEVILPSYTFVSAGNAFVLRGAKLVYVDIHPDTMNINENKIESAITSKTKAILVMHYGGVACEMNKIMEIAQMHDLKVVEDAAHCIDAYYNGKHLGSIGDVGTLSFHATKNIHCGEGGALLINNEKLIERAEIIREKGTNRSKFIKGILKKYSWVDIGSSYLMSEMTAAFLYAQLLDLKTVTQAYKNNWLQYSQLITSHSEFESPVTDVKLVESNAHIFYIKCKTEDHRRKLTDQLSKAGIKAYFHYVPLHSSLAGTKYGRFHGEDIHTTKESLSLLRLPLFSTLENVQFVVDNL